MKNHKISVIIPTYNRSEFILRAINSVLDQTHSVYEIIIVDDGSTDDTKKIIIESNLNVRYIYQVNGGAASARNKGIIAAKGNWIAFLDSDDIWKPYKIEKQLETLLLHDVDVICSGYDDDIGGGYNNLTPTVPIGEYKYFDNALNLVFENNTHPYVQSLLIKKSLIIKIGLFDESLRMAEDSKLFYRIAFETGIGYINEPLFTLNRQREVGLTDNKAVSSILSLYDSSCRVQCDAYWLLIPRDKNLTKLVGENMGYFMSRLSEVYYVLNKFNLSKFYAKESFKYAGEFKTKLRCLIMLVFPKILKNRIKKKYSFD